MSKVNLTDKYIQAIKIDPDNKRVGVKVGEDENKKPIHEWSNRTVDIYDTGVQGEHNKGGLILRVSYGGAKAWRVLYYVDQRPKTLRLGRYPDGLGIREAREAARKFLGNPSTASAEERRRSFKEVAQDFVDSHASRLKGKTEVERCINKYLLKNYAGQTRWEHRRFRDLAFQDVTTLMQDVAKHSGPRQADIVVGIVSKMMAWYKKNRDPLFHNPLEASQPDRLYSVTENARERVLDDVELRALWKACIPGDVFSDFVTTLLLTGQRRRKVVTMKWTELENGAWNVAEESKRDKGTPRTVPLPWLVREVIDGRPEVAGNPFVFPGVGKQPFNTVSQGKRGLDARMLEHLEEMSREAFVAEIRALMAEAKSKDERVAEEAKAQLKRRWWTLHDLRRTCRTRLADLDVDDLVAEMVLGHKLQGVRRTYNRHSYARAIGDALERLSDHVAGVVGIPLPAKVRREEPAHGFVLSLPAINLPS